MSFLLLAGLLAQVNVAARDVDVPSFDGQRLSATYYSPGTPGPGVMLFRNCDQRRASMDSFAKKLRARGVHVIVHDYRGGQAPGRSWQETRTEDATHIHRWLLSQPGVDSTRLAAVGGSCGVQVTLDFAIARPSGLLGVVILSGPSSDANRAFIANTPLLAVLGGTSRAEGGERSGFIQPVVAASKHPASRMVMVPTGHGMEILDVDAEFAASVLTWLSERLKRP
jgi:dienelactone hydrolase